MQTLTPASCSCLTRVWPRRIGPVSKRPCSTALSSGFVTMCRPGPGDVVDQPVRVRVVVGVHRRGVARGDPAGHAAPDRLGRHHLDEAGVVVVGLVAVDVDAQAVLVGQRDRELDRLDAVLAGQLVVRDPADHVRAELDGLAHQLPAAVEAEDPLLRERDELQVDHAAHLLAQVDQRPQRPQLRVAHVDVAADVLHAAGELPAQDLPYPRLHVLVGQVRRPARPTPRCPRTASRTRSAAAGRR